MNSSSYSYALSIRQWIISTTKGHLLGQFLSDRALSCLELAMFGRQRRRGEIKIFDCLRATPSFVSHRQATTHVKPHSALSDPKFKFLQSFNNCICKSGLIKVLRVIDKGSFSIFEDQERVKFDIMIIQKFMFNSLFYNS